MRFSAVYKPTALFSLKDSSSTGSGAKSLFLPSPYAIKMAFLNQAITLGGEDFTDSAKFSIIRDTKVSYRIFGQFCVNNCFVKIQKQRDKNPFTPTVSFREYIFMDNPIEIIFEVKEETDVILLKKYLHRINYFGKRACFFQFANYNDHPDEPNVKIFNPKHLSSGLLQEYDDFEANCTFKMVNSYSEAKTKRNKEVLIVPLRNVSSSKSYTCYEVC